MKAKDIMTKSPIALKPTNTVAEAIRTLIDNKISGAPVEDETGRMIGLVTEKDLIVSYDFLQDVNSAVMSFMSKDIISVDEETPVEEISKLLVQRNIKRVPVAKDNKVIGIVSRRDVLRYILEENK